MVFMAIKCWRYVTITLINTILFLFSDVYIAWGIATWTAPRPSWILYPKDATIHWSRCCSRRIRLHVILNGIVWRIRSLNSKRSQKSFWKKSQNLFENATTKLYQRKLPSNLKLFQDSYVIWRYTKKDKRVQREKKKTKERYKYKT